MERKIMNIDEYLKRREVEVRSLTQTEAKGYGVHVMFLLMNTISGFLYFVLGPFV